MLPLLAIMFTVLDLSIAIFVKNTVQFSGHHGGAPPCRRTRPLKRGAGVAQPWSSSPSG